MSSLANYHNHATSVSMSEFDDENECDRQNESMMHKVKDVVSKILHPSFLFSTNNDIDRPKRKRSTSVEENDDEEYADATTNGHTTPSKSRRPIIRDDEPQLTDDEDNNNRDVTELEQQKKRRRTANYQHILSSKTTDSHHEDERISPSSTSTDNVRSLSNLRTDQTSLEQNLNERMNRLTSSKQRFNIPSTYRGSIPNYDPSKSPLFSAGVRNTTTHLKSNEFSANYLLANSLVNRTQTSTSTTQQSPATLTNPITTTNNNNRLFSNERQMFGANYASINSRRLPYIERLRRRTLQDCIRLNRTLDNEPLSISTIEEHKSTKTSPAPKRTKATEKECGIQCDISIVENSIEPSKKIQRTFPPEDIRNESLSIPITEKTQSKSQIDSSIQTNSSITIEKVQPPIPTIDITKPKVLGNITPFSWPKFARAQEEFAKKYPEKCRVDAVPPKSVAPSNIVQPNVNITSTIPQQTNTITNTTPKMPILPSSSSRPTESIWRCPSCTKEHPAQTASCSLCHRLNPDYKKLSAIQPAEKEAVPSNKLPDVIAKQPTTSSSVTNQTIPTTTKESISFIPPAVTTSASFPLFGTTPTAFSSATTKENPVVTTASLPFGTAPILSFTAPTTTKENPVSTNAPFPLFGASPTPITKENLTATTTLPAFALAVTKENPVSTTASVPLFGTSSTKEIPTTISTPPAFGLAVTKENPVSTTAPVPLFGISSTKEAPTTISTPPAFGLSVTKENPVSTTAPAPLFGMSSTKETPTPFSTPLTFGTPVTKENLVSTSAPPPLFGTQPTASPKAVTKENPVTTSAPFSINTFPTFGTTPITPLPTTIKETPVTTTASHSFDITIIDKPLSPSVNNPYRIPIKYPTFGAIPSTSPTAAVTNSATPSIITITPSIPTPFGAFGSSSTATTLSNQATSIPSLTTSTSTTSNFFGSSSIASAPATTATTGITFPVSSTTSAFTAPNNFAFTSATTTSTPPTFGSSGFSFTPASTTITASNPSFGLDAGSSSTPFGTAITSSINSNTASPFGAPPTSVSPFSSALPSSFNFGAIPTTNQTSAAPVSVPSGFSFAPAPSAVPVFGAGPPPLLSSGPFGFGVTPVATTNIGPFQFSGTASTPMASNSFSTSVPSESAVDTSNPFSISVEDSTMGARHVLKAKRRRVP